jgi:hypothetical protein
MFQYILIILALIVGFLYFGYQYKDSFLLIFAGLITIFLAAIILTGSVNLLDDSKTCESVVANSTISSNNNTITYEYESFCFNTTNDKITFRQIIFGIAIIAFGFYFMTQGLQTIFMKTQ